ncbi:hypothetical protein BVY02_01635 [bacterium J17]|nr:hypothetical protein BVY02_01635 [bacterium J17]
METVTSSFGKTFARHRNQASLNFLVLFLVSSFLLSSCFSVDDSLKSAEETFSTLSDDDKLPGVSIPKSFDTTSAALTPAEIAQLLDNWWTVFEDEDLNVFMTSVINDSLALKRAAYQTLQHYEKYRQNYALYWPEFGVSAQADRSKLDVRTFGNTSSNFQFSAPVSYEVDLWGRIRAKNIASLSRLFASQEELYSLAMTVSANLVDRYFHVVELCKRVDLTDRTINADKRRLNLLLMRYQDGVASSIDVYRAREILASRRAERPRIMKELGEAQAGLLRVAGRYPESRSTCGVKDFPELTPLPIVLPSDLLIRRPDVLAALHRIKAADADLSAAFADRFPKLSLTASGGYANTEPSDVFIPESLVWRITAGLAGPLIDFGRRRAVVREKEAVVVELSLAYMGTVLDAYQDVEIALLGRTELSKRVALLDSKVSALSNTLRLETEQYFQGVSDYLPVLISQRSLFLAQSELIVARRQQVSNYVQLAKSLGGGWSKSDVRDSFAFSNLEYGR